MTRDRIQQEQASLRHDFDRDGYLSVPGFFDADEVAELNANTARYIREVVPGMPASEVYYEDKEDSSTLKQLQMMWKHDATFGALVAAEGKLSALAEACLGERPRPVNLQYFNKSPRANTPTPPHQDGYYFHLVPCHAITLWMALEDVEPEQGCVHYVQGSHRRGMRSHGPSGILGFSQAILDFGTPADRAQARSFPCRAGHLIAHHALTIHWAEGNQAADRSRQALGAIFYAASAREDPVAQAAYQAKLDARLARKGII